MKQLTAIFLALSMLMPMAIPALASEEVTSTVSPIKAEYNEKSQLAIILTAVKSVIDIPQEYTEFNYNTNNNYEAENWYLHWSNIDGNKSIDVSTDKEGRISNYNVNDNSDNNSSKAPLIFKADALVKAKEQRIRISIDNGGNLIEEKIKM